jgi:hypothetical protein
VGKPEGRRPLGRPRRGQVDNIKIDREELGWGAVDWSGLAQDRDKWRACVNAVINLRVPKMLGSSLVAAQLAASRVLLSPTELLGYIFRIDIFYIFFSFSILICLNAMKGAGTEVVGYSHFQPYLPITEPTLHTSLFLKQLHRFYINSTLYFITLLSSEFLSFYSINLVFP